MERNQDALQQTLQNHADIQAPPGFAHRVLSNLPTPEPARRNPYFIAGVLCVSGAFIMMFVLNSTVLMPVALRLLDSMKGLFL